MSVFRPLNSEESNLFTIRLIINSHDFNTDKTLVDEGDDTETYLLNPTVNNLPSNFSVKFNSTETNYEIEFGKTFTSYPNIHVTSLSSASTANDDIIAAYTPSIILYSLLSTAGTVNAYITFRNSNGERQQAKNGFMLTITGPVKLGVTTGNSNKGWGVGSGSDPSKVYSYMDVGIGTGNPTSSLDVSQGTFLYQPYVSTITAATTLTSYTSGAVFFVSNSTANNYEITLPEIDSTYVKYKFIFGEGSESGAPVNLGSGVKITESTNSTTIYGNAVIVGSSFQGYGNTITVSAGATAGDYVEIVSDGKYYYANAVFGGNYYALA